MPRLHALSIMVSGQLGHGFEEVDATVQGATEGEKYKARAMPSRKSPASELSHNSWLWFHTDFNREESLTQEKCLSEEFFVGEKRFYPAKYGGGAAIVGWLRKFMEAGGE